MTPSLDRAELLMAQQRWDLAEGELRQVLSQDSQHAEAHACLAMCLAHREKFDDAEQEARQAVHLAPDSPFSHWTMAHVMNARRRFPEAMLAVEESLRLNPYQPHAFGMLAHLRFLKSDWQQALAAAEQGLQLDPENVACNNLRAMALVKLGRREEAGRTIAATLAKAPEDSNTHANQGWTLLEAGDRKQAMLHFREALRLDPMNDWAKRGIVEAMKSKNFIYRWLLAYFFFMARFSSRAQMAIVVGLFVGQRLAVQVASSNPAMAPYVNVLLLLYAGFALLTWLGSSLMNLVLFTDRFGRLTLSADQRRGAMLIGAVLSAVLLSLAACFAFEGETRDVALLTPLYLALVALPTSSIFRCSNGWPRWTMAGVSSALGIVAIGPLLYAALLSPAPKLAGLVATLWSKPLDLFVVAAVGSQFLAIAMSQITPRR